MKTLYGIGLDSDDDDVIIALKTGWNYFRGDTQENYFDGSEYEPLASYEFVDRLAGEGLMQW